MSRFTVEYKTDEASAWTTLEMFEEEEATSYATELLVDGLIVRLTEYELN
jgi:hypothetical protein